MLVDELVENLGISYTDLAKVIDTAPARYRVFPIDKRNGGKREIAHPARELKAIQRYLLREKLVHLETHPSATAYKAGSSIFGNADRHVDAEFILKLDFENFFPSIKTSDWVKFARAKPLHSIDRGDIPTYAKIFFWGSRKNHTTPRCLSIGAPTSPALSNILMHAFDTELSDYAGRLHVTYTRYADDITISGQHAAPVLEFERLARRAVAKRRSPSLIFNDEKRRFCTKGGRRSVTGLILTPDRKISIGRDRKRLISAMLHRLALGTLADEQKGQLKGFLGFCIAVEVSFIESLRSKYGNSIIDQALRYHIPPKSSATQA